MNKPPSDNDWTEEANKERLKQTVNRLNGISESMNTHDLMEVPDFDEGKKEEVNKTQEEKKDGQV